MQFLQEFTVIEGEQQLTGDRGLPLVHRNGLQATTDARANVRPSKGMHLADVLPFIDGVGSLGSSDGKDVRGLDRRGGGTGESAKAEAEGSKRGTRLLRDAGVERDCHHGNGLRKDCSTDLSSARDAPTGIGVGPSGTICPTRTKMTQSIRGMRIPNQLALGLVASCASILGPYGIYQVRQEAFELRATAEHHLHTLGSALRVAVENSLRDQQVDDVFEILDSIELRDAGVDVLVFDETGSLMASSGSHPQARDQGLAFVRRVASDSASALFFDDPASPGQLVGVFRMYDDTHRRRGAVVVARPLDELRRDLRSTTLVIATTCTTLTLGITAIGWLFIVVSLRNPLDQLIRAMMAIRDGNLVTRVPVTRRDELGAVAHHFNAMAEQLAETRRRLIATSEAREALESGLRRVDKLVTVGQLSAGLAHEIGSPLQIMSGRARALAARQDLPPDVVRAAGILEQQADRISAIVEQLLSVARRKAPQVTTVDLGRIVSTIIELTAPSARKRSVALVFDCDEALPTVHADGDRIQQVVLNLLSNALRATREGGTIRVTLSLAPADPSAAQHQAPCAMLVVEDDGCGMSAEIQSHIFEPFFTTWGDTAGTGLGLAVAKSIVDEHGGSIHVWSEEGRGARFRVLLPIHPNHLGPTSHR